MIRRRSIALACTAVIACAVATLVLAVRLTQAGQLLRADAMPELGVVQRIDHDLGALSHALADPLAASSAAPVADVGRREAAEVAEAVWRERFEVLHAAAIAIERGRTGSSLERPGARATIEAVHRFVDAIDERLADGPDPDVAWLEATMRGARDLSGRTHAIALGLYLDERRLRDRVGERLDRLNLGLVLSGSGFMLAGLVLVGLLAHASRHANRLMVEALEAQRLLDAAHDELTDGDTARRSQRRFLAQATHDLRQPLQALQYYLAALDAHVGTDRGREILAQIARSTGAAQHLLAELLDISKLDAGVLEARRSPTDLDELLERLHEASSPEAQARGLALHVERSGLWVDTDGPLLSRILGNLVSNALAYTREGAIDIRAAPGADPQRVILSVSDTGIGIPRAEREAIFDEYHRLDGPDRDPERGIGIGLAIVRRLARLLDIPVRVESELGRGTRFELAVARAAAPALPAAVAAAAPPPATAPPLAGLVVLVIDDEPDVLDGIASLLAQRGCTVLKADGRDAAIDRLVERAVTPDLIVADYRLRDGGTGVEAIEAVRDELNEHVPAIVVTGDTAPERLREASAGGLPLLHKPVDADRLFEAMRCSTGLAA